MTTTEKALFYTGVVLILGAMLANIFHYFDPTWNFFLLMMGTVLQFNGQSRYNRRLRQRLEELEAQQRS